MIGTLNEKPLHAALKEWVARPGDLFEQSVDGYVIDLVRGDLLIEIQTGSFAPLKKKLRKLLADHPVRLIFPVAEQKWILKMGVEGSSRRKSPRRGGVESVFSELVYIPHLLEIDGFSLSVLLIHEEEVRRHHPDKAWRRKGWMTEERRLLKVVDEQRFTCPADLAALLPASLPSPFTSADLALALGQPRRLAQQMTYCLRKMGVIKMVGKFGQSLAYARKIGIG